MPDAIPYPSVPHRADPTVSLQFLQASGLLFEINRVVLHPLGMALAVVFDDDGKFCENEVHVVSTDDPAGMVFSRGSFEDENGAADRLRQYMAFVGNAKHRARVDEIGVVIQTGPLAGD